MNERTQFLSTAQFAELCDVEKSTLRFYRDRGVLLPSRVQENGYGKYEPLQGLNVAHIKLLETCGFSLKEIEENDRQLSFNFPYDRVLALLESEQKSLSAKNAMLSAARLISENCERAERSIQRHCVERKYFLYLKYSKPSEDIEYNLIHSIKLITRLSRIYLGTFPFVLGRVIEMEDIRAERSQKVMGLVIPIPEDIALSGEIPEENLLQMKETDTVRMCYYSEPYSYREPYEQVFRHIRETGLEICGNSVELWTIGNRPAAYGTYATLIDIPVSDG